MTNTTIMKHTYAAYRSYEVATQAVAALVDHGVNKDHIYLMTKNYDDQFSSEGTEDIKDHATGGITVTTPEDAREGAAKGAGIGLGIGVVAGLAALAIPGVGLIVGGGALATAIGGAVGATAAGALAGAVAGYLRDQGIDERTISTITQRLEVGDIVVSVDLAEESITLDEVRAILSKYEGVEMLNS
jgi:hypothetical protein